MKANEVPNKLYYAPYGDIREDYPITDNDIEYTRTDAFIEKACAWLEKYATYIHPRKGKEECMVNLTRFRDYMKGE